MTREIDYRRAFKIACDLLNGDILYGVDSDKIFDFMMARDGFVTKNSYEEYILNHLQELDHGEYAIKALEQAPILDKIRSEIEEHAKINQNLNIDRAKALCWCLDLIDKYKAETEDV